MAATFGMGITACGDKSDTDSTTTTNTGGSVTTVTAPKGTVTGQIVDTNGNPVAGATVYIADGSIASPSSLTKSASVRSKATVQTDAAGQFSIPNVVAQAVANAGGGTPSTSYNLPIQLFVDSPAGFLDVTVQVKPEAQVVNAQPGGVSGGQTNAPLVFVDGFVASTGTIKTPALTTKVIGKLRDSSTGAPVNGKTLTLDFKNIANDQDPDGTKTAVTYATTILVATTANDGSFEFLNVADDSELTLRAGRATLSKSDVLTDNEGAHTTDLGPIDFTLTDAGDVVSPFISKVDQVVSVGGDLASSFTDTFTIRFSETLSAGSAAVVKVTVAGSGGGAEEIVGATASLSGNLLTVKTASPIGAGKTVRVYIASEQITDEAGNTLASDPPPSTPDPVLYDSKQGRDVVLEMQTYTPPVTGLQPVTNLGQIFNALNTASPYYLSTDALIDTVEDSIDGAGIYSQLNAPEAADQLAVLIDILEDGTTLAGSDHLNDVKVSTARVGFTSSGATRYAYVLVNSDGTYSVPSVTAIAPTNLVGGAVVLDGNIGGGNSYPTLKPSSTATVDIIAAVTNASAGQVLKIVPVGELNGNPVVSQAAVSTLPLTDKVAPAATGQTLLLAAAAKAEGGSASSGGNLVLGASAAAGGKVIYPVTPQLYDITDIGNNNTPSGFTGDQLDGGSELEGLSSDALKNTAGFASSGSTEYDTTGAVAFLSSVKGTIAVNVTESLGGTQPLPTISGAATVFSGPGALNGISDETGAGPYYVYTVGIDSTEKLQADARAKRTLGLAGITDVLGNASASAAVELRDFTPPVMTKAFFDGTYWVFQFNEPVKGNAGAITLQATGDVINLAAASDGSVPEAARSRYFVDGAGATHEEIIVIPVANPQTAGINAGVAFGGTAYVESGYANVAALTVGNKSLTALPQANLAAVPKHGLISYASVQDKSNNTDIGGQDGNSWDNWSLNGMGISAPTFYGANILGPYTESLRGATLFTSGRVLAAGNNTFSVDLDFTHAIDLSAADTNTDGKLSSAEVTSYVAARLGVFINNSGAVDPTITVNSADVGSFVNGNFVPAAVTNDNTFRNLKQGSALRVTFSGTAGEVIEATNRISITAGQFTSAIDPNLRVGADDMDATLKEATTAGSVTTTEFAPIGPNDAGTGTEKAF